MVTWIENGFLLDFFACAWCPCCFFDDLCYDSYGYDLCSLNDCECNFVCCFYVNEIWNGILIYTVLHSSGHAPILDNLWPNVPDGDNDNIQHEADYSQLDDTMAHVPTQLQCFVHATLFHFHI